MTMTRFNKAVHIYTITFFFLYYKIREKNYSEKQTEVI